MGALVDTFDPFVPDPIHLFAYKNSFTVLEDIELSDYDVVILITDHDQLDYTKILNNSQLLRYKRQVPACFKSVEGQCRIKKL